MKGRITFPREVLLVEIERHCSDPHCNQRARVGLTKDEARAYKGFKCERCEAWNDDVLEERDVPDWWEELTVTGLDGLRFKEDLAEDEPSEPIQRMSDAWRNADHRDEDER